MKNNETIKTTNAIKKHLKLKYGIKASIRSSFYSGGSSIRIEYVGGVNPSVIEKELEGITYGNFDGMTDCYDYDSTRKAPVICDVELMQFSYLFVTRTMPREFYLKLAQFISNNTNYTSIHKVRTMDDLERRFDNLFSGCWDWAQLIRKMTSETHFATADVMQIELLEQFDAAPWQIGFLYEFGNRAFSTSDVPVLKSYVLPVNVVHPGDFTERDEEEYYAEFATATGAR